MKIGKWSLNSLVLCIEVIYAAVSFERLAGRVWPRRRLVADWRFSSERLKIRAHGTASRRFYQTKARWGQSTPQGWGLNVKCSRSFGTAKGIGGTITGTTLIALRIKRLNLKYKYNSIKNLKSWEKVVCIW